VLVKSTLELETGDVEQIVVTFPTSVAVGIFGVDVKMGSGLGDDL
jgi:hypothetical protein